MQAGCSSNETPVEDDGSGSGITALQYQYRLIDIKDGFSHTYLLGEKYIDRDAAKSGTSWGDDQGPFVSDQFDTMRYAVYSDGTKSERYLAPHRDTRGDPNNSNDANYGITGMGIYNFGSAHPHGFNMAMCDGSVHHIPYTVDEQIHRRLCNRCDRQPVTMPD